jgi:hypothetical protein
MSAAFSQVEASGTAVRVIEGLIGGGRGGGSTLDHQPPRFEGTPESAAATRDGAAPR